MPYRYIPLTALFAAAFATLALLWATEAPRADDNSRISPYGERTHN